MSPDLDSQGKSTIPAVPDWRRALYVDAGIAGACSVFVGGTVLTAAILWAGGGGFELGLVSRGQIGGLDVVVVLFILSAIGRSASGLALLAPEEARRRPFARVPVVIPAPEVG